MSAPTGSCPSADPALLWTLTLWVSFGILPKGCCCWATLGLPGFLSATPGLVGDDIIHLVVRDALSKGDKGASHSAFCDLIEVGRRLTGHFSCSVKRNQLFGRSRQCTTSSRMTAQVGALLTSYFRGWWSSKGPYMRWLGGETATVTTE